ncbi:hypothetical protein LINPERPRIM_LOCUS22310 [Linum perenne]
MVRNAGQTRNTISQCDYYSYCLQTRLQNRSTLLVAGRLFQQYVVNAYALVEAERLDWIRNNQRKLHSHYFHGLVDAYRRGDSDLEHTGKHIILASSHTGSPRYKYENFQDAVAICRTLGFPGLFITFTCNTQWPEVEYMISLLLEVEKKDPNHAEVLARVFKLKLNRSMSEIKTKEIFGRCIAFMNAIEFQKRGLPHAHMLVFLSAEDKIHSTEQIDSIISAEIPDIKEDPWCYDLVTKFMFHGPCGALNSNAPCTIDRKCNKHFPKAFCICTAIDVDGFPRYRRSDNGRSVTKNGAELDNQYVVPYNRYLLLRFDAHINVEFCNKSRAIKYLFKYINKPPDRAMATIVQTENSYSIDSTTDIDEIKAFMDCRYLTAGEACWRIFKFDLYTNTPAVMRLSYHLPGQQPVYSNTRLRLEELVEVELAHTSMLLEWMKLNAYYPGARQYTFVEFPQHFVWNREAKAWKPRKNKQCIGSLYYCHPSSQEVFYLRMLLHTVKGCTSFEDIRTVNGKTYDSFKQTCNAHGFLTDDGEWNHCLEEVSFTATAREMRKLFVTKLLYCQVSDVKSLWEKNWTLLSDDILFSRRQELRLPNLELSIEETKILCLLQLQNILRGFGKTLADIQGLPAPPVDSTLHLSNSLLAEEMNYDCAALQAQFQSNFMKLNTEQKAAYNQIMESVETNGHQLFFIDGYGGTGKTFLWQVISMKLRADKKVVYV